MVVPCLFSWMNLTERVWILMSQDLIQRRTSGHSGMPPSKRAFRQTQMKVRMIITLSGFNRYGYASQRALQRLALYQAKSRAFGMPRFIRNIRKSLGCEPLEAQTVPAAWVRDMGLPKFTHAPPLSPCNRSHPRDREKGHPVGVVFGLGMAAVRYWAALPITHISGAPSGENRRRRRKTQKGGRGV